MLRRIAVVVFALGLTPGWALQADLDTAAAVQKAGLQRMLGQRIAKAYCQISLDVEARSSRVLLGQSVVLFDTQLAELTRFVADAESRTTAADLARIWGPFRIRATGPITRAGCSELAEASEPLLAAAHRLTGLIQCRAAGDLERLVNVSGRQRMLTQRLMLPYMASIAGGQTDELRDRRNAAVAEFAAGLDQLQTAAGSTPATRRHLDDIALQWEWFRSVMELQSAGSYYELVANASQSILHSLEIITKEYEALIRGQQTKLGQRDVSLRSDGGDVTSHAGLLPQRTDPGPELYPGAAPRLP